jgi:hypothetical protein
MADVGAAISVPMAEPFDRVRRAIVAEDDRLSAR